MGSLWQDLKIGLRVLRRSPGFAAIAIATLALGIGANTAIFTLLDAVLLKSLPIRNPSRLVMLHWESAKPADGLFKNHFEWAGSPTPATESFGCAFTYGAFQAVRERAGGLGGWFGFAGPFQIVGNVSGRSHLADAELVTGDYFATLGVRPILGRSIGPEDDRDAAPVAVLSYREWQENFGGNPAIIGRSFDIGKVPVTVIGVAPPEFFGLQPGYSPDLWLPLHLLEPLHLSFLGSGFSLSDKGVWWLQVAGRLKPGVSPEEAGTQADAIFHQVVAADLGPSSKVQIPSVSAFSLSRGLDSLRNSFSRPLALLMTLVGLVLLIACVNVAGLLLTRAAGREREMSIRVALGASRAMISRQLLVESLLLSALGGIAGWVLSLWGASLLGASLGGSDAFQVIGIRPDWRVLLFTLGLSLVAGLVAGLVPAFRAGRADASPALKAGLSAGGSRSETRLTLGLGRALVIAQVAVALLVSCAAGLFARTLINLEHVRLGFQARNLLLFQLNPDLSGYPEAQRNALYKNVRQQLAALPGVRSVTWSSFAFVSNWRFSTDLKFGGREYQDIAVLWAGPGFFQTMGIPVLLGRGIDSGDEHGAARVAVVNQALARKIGVADPVGLHFTGDAPGMENAGYSVVGMVGNTRYASLRDAPPPAVFFPDLQGGLPGVTFEVRTARDPAAIIPAVRQTLARLAPDVPLSEVKTQTEQLDAALSTERQITRLSLLFAILALALSCLGLYGLLAYSVVRRTAEIGLRMALGAAREEVLGMVLASGAKLAAVGIAIGLALAIALDRLIAGMLYGVGGVDPVTLAATAVVLALVALLACYIPARRAMRIDPVTALRQE